MFACCVLGQQGRLKLGCSVVADSWKDFLEVLDFLSVRKMGVGVVCLAYVPVGQVIHWTLLTKLRFYRPSGSFD